MAISILLLNGPNLNMLGTREPQIYGSQTLEDVETLCKNHAEEKGASLSVFQSNHEGDLVDAIQKARGHYDAIVFNPGAYTHTSIAIRDAITAAQMAIYEVHLSNVHAREEFRHHSYVSGVAKAVIAGLGVHGYLAAIDEICDDA